MDDLDNYELCTECASIDPVGTLLNGESRTQEGAKFTLASGQGCIFCDFCANALNSTRAVARKQPLEGEFEVTVNVEPRWGYEATSLLDCDVYWLRISVVDDTAVLSDLAPDSIYVQIIPDAKGCVSDEECYLYGRRVDLRLIKFWMSQCADNHQDTCRSTMPIRPDLPEYLINTSSLMLVPKPGDCGYAALSYCWGDPHVPQLKLKDLKEQAPRSGLLVHRRPLDRSAADN